MAGFIKRRKWVILLVLGGVVAIGLVLFHHSIGSHLRAMSVLQRFASPNAKGFGTRFSRHPFQEEAGSAPLRYRIYKPADVSNPGGIVLLHGVHHLGIDDPRLANFARALAAAGIEVMTPELHDLTDYHVTPETIDRIGISAGILSKQMNLPRVGVIGLSFAGGLALMAACKPEYAEKIGFVVAIGSHDDLGRVSRFFAVDSIEKPDGSTMPLPAHEYGVLILAYSHLEDFFSAADEPAAKEALRLWLWEQPQGAMKAGQRLSPEGQQEFDLLVHHRDELQQKFLEEIKLHYSEMLAVSPHGQLTRLNVPVFLLHGAGDSVIPASETLWLAKDVPHQDLMAVLVSPALIHVNMEDGVSFSQKWDLVDFLAKVIASTDQLAAR